MEEVYEQRITTLVGEVITLETELTWDHGRRVYPRATTENDTLYASQLAIDFTNADRFIERERFRGQDRGNTFVNSNLIAKSVDAELKEQYYFKEKRLFLDTTYHLKGSFRYRDWLGVDAETLSNPEFIEQSNDVTYWRQTFEFIPESIQLVER